MKWHDRDDSCALSEEALPRSTEASVITSQRTSMFERVKNVYRTN